MCDQDKPVLILTNDDGVDAPGIQALRRAAGALGRCRVIAPTAPHSGCGHQVTTHGPIRIHRRDEDTLAIDGTPADCVRLALTKLAPDARWFLSGINAGGNLGSDVYISGTVAAAREAAIQGVPAIALSHYIARGGSIDWIRAEDLAARVLKALMARLCLPGTYWNVNLPHLPPEASDPAIVFCPLDPSPLPLSYQIEGDEAVYTGNYQRRARRPGDDVAVCFGGRISATLLRVDHQTGLVKPSGKSLEVWPIPPCS